MAVMTRASTPIPESRHRLVRTAVMVALFWSIAAVAVISAHFLFDHASPNGAAVASIAAILICAFGYTRMQRERGMSHALGVGIAWLALGILTEIATTTSVGHDWYGVLGSPVRPLLRNVILFAWIFSPALFARRTDNE